MTRFLATLGAALLIGGASLAGPVAAQDYGDTRFIKVGGGPTGGGWYSTAAAWSVLIQKNLEVPTSVVPGGGEKNAKAVQSDELQAGIAFTWGAEDAMNGKGNYGTPHDKLRHVASLYNVAWQAATPRDSDIRSITDLNGRVVSFGNKGESGIALAEAILAAHDMSFEGIEAAGGQIVYIGMGQAVDLVQNGQLELTAQLTSMPQGAYMNMNSNPGIRLIGIEAEAIARLREKHPKYAEVIIPAGTYEGIDAPVRTVGAISSFVASADLSADLVYDMTRVLWENWDEMRKANKALPVDGLGNALTDARVPLHPGAERFYREKGMLD